MHPQALLDSTAQLLARVLRFEHPADAVVARFFREHRGLGPRERSALSEAVYAVLRRRLLFEAWALGGSGPLERRLAILGLAAPAGAAAAQNAPAPAPATASREALLTVLSPAERQWLAEGPTRGAGDLPAPLRHDLPPWLADALQAQLGEPAFLALADSLLQPAPLDLRVNVLKEKRDRVRAELGESAIDSISTPYSPWGLRLAGKPSLARLDAFARGAFEVQDEGAQLLALLLHAQRGETVVDFCAGAGGKTLALGAAMRNTGRLYAFDTSAHRLEALKPRLARSGLDNVHTAVIAHERDERLQRLAGKVDRVVVDAPCSGLGTLRRNPDLKWRQSPQEVRAFAERQGAILQAAARLLKPGGRLVYATCSLLAEENEQVADAFSAAHAAFEPLDTAALLAGLKVPQAAELCAGGDGGTRYLRLWPHRHGTDGFFAACWNRR